MIWECWQWGREVVILNKLARASPMEEVTFEKRPEEDERASNMNMLGRSITDSKNS